MTASREAILETVNAYVRLVAGGTTDEIMDLFAEGATVEDPLGTDVRSTRESIREFYATLQDLKQTADLKVVRVGDGQAAFWFELITHADGATYTVAPIDVMTFNDDGKITSMRAFWSDADFQVS
jgi:steroid delta-isomerase